MTPRFACVLALAALGCADADPEPPPDTRLSSLESDLFTTSCALSASCHRGGTPKADLNLEPPVHGKIVERASSSLPSRVLVVPGDPMASFLFEKVSQNRPAAGARMPVGQPLPPLLIERLKGWIEAGAQDD